MYSKQSMTFESITSRWENPGRKPNPKDLTNFLLYLVSYFLLYFYYTFYARLKYPCNNNIFILDYYSFRIALFPINN